MKYPFFLFPLLACVLWTGGCIDQPYIPPQRPLAGMYPTLLPARELKAFTPVASTQPQLESCLKELGVWEELLSAGLLPQELSVVVRSLARRGYGELDLRRCADSSLEWVAFVGYPQGAMTIIANPRGHTEQLRRTWNNTDKP